MRFAALSTSYVYFGRGTVGRAVPAAFILCDEIGGHGPPYVDAVVGAHYQVAALPRVALARFPGYFSPLASRHRPLVISITC
jgi:hypothetical protein